MRDSGDKTSNTNSQPQKHLKLCSGVLGRKKRTLHAPAVATLFLKTYKYDMCNGFDFFPCIIFFQNEQFLVQHFSKRPCIKISGEFYL